MNPYAAPAAAVSAAAPGSFVEAERIRRELFRDESRVKSAGFLYLLGGLSFGSTVLIFVFGVFAGAGNRHAFGAKLAVLAFLGLLAAGYCWVGYRLRRLEPVERTTTIALAVLGLTIAPVGTLIGIYLVYFLASGKGRRVLSPEYRLAVAATPHIRDRAIWVTVGLLLLQLPILAGTLFVMLGP